MIFHEYNLHVLRTARMINISLAPSTSDATGYYSGFVKLQPQFVAPLPWQGTGVVCKQCFELQHESQSNFIFSSAINEIIDNAFAEVLVLPEYTKLNLILESNNGVRTISIPEFDPHLAPVLRQLTDTIMLTVEFHLNQSKEQFRLIHHTADLHTHDEIVHVDFTVANRFAQMVFINNDTLAHPLVLATTGMTGGDSVEVYTSICPRAGLHPILNIGNPVNIAGWFSNVLIDSHVNPIKTIDFKTFDQVFRGHPDPNLKIVAIKLTMDNPDTIISSFVNYYLNRVSLLEKAWQNLP